MLNQQHLQANLLRKIFSLTLVILLPLEIIFYLYSDPLPEAVPKLAEQHQWITVKWHHRDVRRLGNELFDFAASVGVGKQHGLRVMAASSMRIAKVFWLEGVRMVDNQEAALSLHIQYNERIGYDCKFDERLMVKFSTPPHHNLALAGYFQSFKYFEAAQKELSTMLTFRPEVLKRARSFLHSELSAFHLNTETYVIIGIHIRRGDVLSDPKIHRYGYVEAPVSYFEHAVEYFKKTLPGQELVFVLCSDEISWAKKHLKHLDDNLIFSMYNSPSVDLAVLSLCDHVIVSSGSFGWWGAWLANGTTVYYKEWPRPDSGLDHHLKKTDYFPPHWIPLV